MTFGNALIIPYMALLFNLRIYPGRQTYAYYSQTYCPIYGDTNMVILSEASIIGPIPIFRVEIRNFRVKIIL